MARIDPNELRQFLLDERLPGIAYALIWGELEENSKAYAALSEVLFDCAAAKDANGAPLRDLSDPKVRAGVTDCAMRYPEVFEAAAKMMRDVRRPWWKFW
jgi:hypothetical protein